jgi:hypothetical protein
MSYAISVMVIDRRTRKGLAGERVKAYGGKEVKTNRSGMATVICKNSSATIYVNGFQVYNSSALSAPNPIIYEKG